MGSCCSCCKPYCPCFACCCPTETKGYIGVTSDNQDEHDDDKPIEIAVAKEPNENEQVQLLSDYEQQVKDSVNESGIGSFTNIYSFYSKQTVILQHHFGQSLQNKDGKLNKDGSSNDVCLWTVQFDGKVDDFIIVKFKNKSNDKYLRIIDDGKVTDCLGNEGKYTRFKVHKTDDNLYKFESVVFPQKYIAVTEQQVTVNNGNELSHFNIWSDAIDKKPEPIDKGVFTNPFGFNSNNQTVIMMHYYGETLRIKPKEEHHLDKNGGVDNFAQFCVELCDEENSSKFVQIKSILSGKYIQIMDDDTVNCLGTGGKHIKFKLHQMNTNLFKFESAVFAGKYIAVSADDVVVGIGDDWSEFTVWYHSLDEVQEPDHPKEEADNKDESEEEEDVGRLWYDNIEEISSFIKKERKKNKSESIELTSVYWKGLSKGKARKLNEILMELQEFVGITKFDLRMTLWERVDERRKKFNTMIGLTKLLYQLVIEYINQKDKKRKKPEEKNVKTFMQYLAQNIIELENFPKQLKKEMEKEAFARGIDNWITALIEKYKGQ